MCITNDPVLVPAFLNRYKDKEFVTCYKILNGNVSPYMEYTYKIGENRSDAKRCQPSVRYEEIKRGIFVWRTKSLAFSYLQKVGYNNPRVVKVFCKPEDLLGMTKDILVFKRVYLK